MSAMRYVYIINHFQTRHSRDNIHMQIGFLYSVPLIIPVSDDLTDVDNKCDLGVNFQSNLQFDKHITNIRAKANRTTGIIKHAFSRIILTCSKIWSNQ